MDIWEVFNILLAWFMTAVCMINAEMDQCMMRSIFCSLLVLYVLAVSVIFRLWTPESVTESEP